MSNFKPSVIVSTAALIVVIITILVLAFGGSDKGLYVLSASGDVILSNSSDGTSETLSITADSDAVKMKSGDVITVNTDGECTLAYRSKNNTDDKNYIIVEPLSQLFITEDFDGSKDGEIYLNRGAIIVCSPENITPNVVVRTANSSYTTASSVTRVEYVLDEENTDYTDAASFGGNIDVTMYNALGSVVTIAETQDSGDVSQLLGSGRSSRIRTGTDTPYFEFLNTEIVLTDYSAYTLSKLMEISSRTDILAFTYTDLNTAYEAVSDGEDNASEADEQLEDETAASETTASEAIQTAVPITTETEAETTTTTAPHTALVTTVTTTAAPVTTTAQPATTTAAPATTADYDDTDDDDMEYCTVTIIIDDEIVEQIVPYGSDAEQPSDPVIDGMTFVGWDGSFTNITSDVTITAQFVEDSTAAVTTTAATDITFTTTTSATSSTAYHTVTIVVGDTTSTVLVADGEDAPLPTVDLDGYTFVGWDNSGTNITSDITITAQLIYTGISTTTTTASSEYYTVTFIVDGVSYPVTVQAGTAATPPITPTTDQYGNTFTMWVGDYSNVTSDMIITALFS